MRPTTQLCAAIFVVSGVTLGVAHAGPPVYPLDQVKAGQTGFGYTTMKGYVPEKFSFEVVGVVKNFLPKQDIILVKSDDPKLAVTGFWQGMSGSPLFVDDKVMCAFSYGFRFNKVVLGGCTPLQYMIDDAKRPRRGPGGAKGAGQLVAANDGHDSVAAATAVASMTSRSVMPAAALPKRTAVAFGSDSAMPAGVPLSVAGFSDQGFNQLQTMFSDTGILPTRGGGAAGGTQGSGVDPAAPSKFVMGGSIAVVLMRGDMSAAATGTVSYVDGNSILAFGHPFFQTGEIYAPVATSQVHTVIASSQMAFVMATPQREIGALWSDRQSSIAADLNVRSPMIPLDIDIEFGPKGAKQHGEFHVEMVDNKFLTPGLAGSAVTNAIAYYLPDRDDVVARIKSSVRIKGGEPLAFVDYVYANDGAASVMGATRGIRVLGPLFNNSYAPVQVEAVKVSVDLTFDTNYGEIKELRLPNNQLTPGQRNYVTVVMETWNGQDIIEQVPVDVPAGLAGAFVSLEVTPGDAAKLDAAPPVDLPTLLAAFRKLLPGDVWAVSLYTEDGLAYEGKALRDIPASVQDKLRPGTKSQKVQSYRPVVRTVSPSARALSGSASTMVRISND